MAGRVTINAAGARAVLTSHGVQAYLMVKAEAIAAVCNAESQWGGYVAVDASGPTRARARVLATGTGESEARRNRLLRNLHAGGLS